MRWRHNLFSCLMLSAISCTPAPPKSESRATAITEPPVEPIRPPLAAIVEPSLAALPIVARNVAAPIVPDDVTVRAKHLLEAIAQGDANLASDILLPRVAFAAIRGGKATSRRWTNEIASRFKRDVALAHRQLRGANDVRFVSFRITPNKRLKTKQAQKQPTGRAQLTFAIKRQLHKIDVAEMILWQGAWYVLRLR